MQAHTFHPHGCSSASEKRKPDFPPLQWEDIKTQKLKVWINSLAIYGLKEILDHFFFSFVQYIDKYCRGVITGCTETAIENLDMGG